MRALFLRTWTIDCEKHWLSLQCLGHEISTLQYDDKPHEQHEELVAAAKAINPDIIVFLGAIEKYHLKPVPQPVILRKFRDIAPTIHLCSDASDHPWWEWLKLYDQSECFDLQVSIDGNFECPIADFKNGLIKLTPTDPAAFKPLPWSERNVMAAITGGLGHGERAALIAFLTASPDVEWVRKVSYEEMCTFMCRSKLSVNHWMNGTGDKYHVKGRVIETGWAGACLLERSNPHTSYWFKPGVEFLEYGELKEASRKLEWVKANSDAAGEIAQRFHERMVKEHHPKVFWGSVFDKLGLAVNDDSNVGQERTVPHDSTAFIE
jgi:hypothetical protein